MSLNTLSQILEKKGFEYVEQFLNNDIVITEKLDTYRILFERKGDNIIFYKKDNTELNLIERTLTDIWETAIIEIPTLLEGIQIPEGLRFGIAYTPVERPLRLPYTNLPTYVLTDITRRKNNKVTEVYDHTEVKKWATVLNMGNPPVIFEGQLTKEQKKVILSYATKDYNGYDKSFSNIINSRISETYSKEDTIEGIIIKSDDKLSQIVSYEYELLNEAYKNNNNTSRDFYDLILLSINSFMNNYNIPVLESINPDENYINIVSDIFNTYCETSNISENFPAEYLSPPNFGHKGSLNTKFIKSDKTKEILEKGEIYESLFKVILSSFRKFKKSYGLLNEKAVDEFNTYVYLINEKIGNVLEAPNKIVKESKNLNESSDNVVIQTYTEKTKSDIDNMRTIASIQKAFEPKALKVKKGTKPCAIYLTDLNPFTKNQEENLHAIYRQWKIPVLIGTILNKNKLQGEKFHFSDELYKAQLDSIAIFNKDIVPNYFMLESSNLTEIFEYARPQYEPQVLIVDEGKKADYVIQLYFEDAVMGGRLNVEEKFNIGEMNIDDKVDAYRAIEENLFYSFKPHTPQAVWSLWDSMYQEYQTWAGLIK